MMHLVIFVHSISASHLIINLTSRSSSLDRIVVTVIYIYIYMYAITRLWGPESMLGVSV